MSIAAKTWAWQQQLPPTPKLILMALSDAADDNGVCWPSVPTLAAKCCVSVRTVQRVMQMLAATGRLVSERRYRKDGSCSSNRYRLLLNGGDNLSPAPDTDDRTPRQPCRRDPDAGVIPGTTIGTQKESSQPQEPVGGIHDPDHTHGGGENDFELVYPKGMLEPERDQARRYLEGLPPELAQQLLDELAAQLSARTIRVTPLAYLRGLIKRARAGVFAPEAGLRVAEARRRKALNQVAIQQAEEAGRQSLPRQVPDNQDPLCERLEAIRAHAACCGKQ